MKEPRPLVCVLVTDDVTPIPGSRQGICVLCKRLVLIAPSSLELGAVDPVCWRCAALGDVEFAHLTDAELTDLYGAGMTRDKILAAWRRLKANAPS